MRCRFCKRKLKLYKRRCPYCWAHNPFAPSFWTFTVAIAIAVLVIVYIAFLKQ